MELQCVVVRQIGSHTVMEHTNGSKTTDLTQEMGKIITRRP